MPPLPTRPRANTSAAGPKRIWISTDCGTGPLRPHRYGSSAETIRPIRRGAAHCRQSRQVRV